MIVLVGYGTEHGSTAGVSERIGQRLRHHGLAVEVMPMTSMSDPSRYDAAVLGSAIHGGKWLPPARQFVELTASALQAIPVWLFSVSTLGEEESMFPTGVAIRLRAMRKDTSEMAILRRAVHPREHHNFAGSIARRDWPVVGRLVFRALGGRYGDHRNWSAIDAWADQIAAELTTSISPSDVERMTG
jgi:menaquinone-dependent protoporphyrinogen oxidase